MFFLVTLAICLTVIIGYMTVFAMDYAIEGPKHDDMRDKVLICIASRFTGAGSFTSI